MLWDQEKKTPSYVRIVVWVLAFHFIFLMLLTNKETKQKAAKSKLAVQTLVEKKEVLSVAQVEPAAPKLEKPAVLEKKAQLSLWEEKKEEFFKSKQAEFLEKEQLFEKNKQLSLPPLEAVKEKKNSPKKVASFQKAEKKTPQKVLKTKSGRTSNDLMSEQLARLEKVKNSLAKLEIDQFSRSETAKAKEKSQPQVLKKTNWTARLSDSFKELSYDPVEKDLDLFFLDYLKKHLQLPEIGEVKIELLIGLEGQVLDVKIISFKSRENSRYLEMELKTFVFPFLKGCLKKEKSFMITFLNEE